MAPPLDTDVAIETPEHVVFHYRLAGPARRCLAHLVDLVLCYGGVALFALAMVLLALGPSGFASFGDQASVLAKAGLGVLLLALFFVQWVYFAAWEAVTGRTPGKAVFGLRVVTTTGRPIGLRAAVLRNVLRAADLLPVGYVAGVASMALSSRFQRLGDLVAGTMVVVPERASAAPPALLSPPVEPTELRDLPDEVALDGDERAAIELFLRRCGTLGRARADELARMISTRIGARLGFVHPDPTRLLAIVYDRAVSGGPAGGRIASGRTRKDWR